MKRGDIFLHKNWLNAERKPLKCVVAKVTDGVVYWKEVGAAKAKHYFKVEDAGRYVLDVVYPAEARELIGSGKHITPWNEHPEHIPSEIDGEISE